MGKRSFLLGVLFLTGLQFGAAHTAAADTRYLVSNYGAVGDGKTVNTLSIQGAIDNIAAAGGGTLIIPKGTYLSGALFFKPGVNLTIEKDGVLKGTTAQADYPLVKTRWEGTEGMHTSAFINFEDGTHVVVNGEGTIDGSGDAFGSGRGRGGFGRAGGPGTQPAGRGAQGGRGGRGSAGGGRGPSTNFVFPQVGRPRLICFKNCTDVHISDLHLQKQAIWCLHFLYCQNVLAENLNIDSVVRTPSSDGIDVDSSRDVEISHCTISCNDDDVAIKSGKDADGRRVNRPTENVHIHDCHILLGDGIAMGSEVTGSIRHVLVENCTFTGTAHSARIKSQPSRGGVIEDIVFRDIKLENPGEAFDFEMAWNLRLERATPADPLTACRNIKLINFSGQARSLGTITGIPGGEIRDVTMENCNITATRGLRVRDAVEIHTEGLHAKVSQGPVIVTGQGAATRPF